jgi:hypothetical protein
VATLSSVVTSEGISPDSGSVPVVSSVVVSSSKGISSVGFIVVPSSNESVVVPFSPS